MAGPEKECLSNERNYVGDGVKIEEGVNGCDVATRVIGIDRAESGNRNTLLVLISQCSAESVNHLFVAPLAGKGESEERKINLISHQFFLSLLPGSLVVVTNDPVFRS